MKPFQQTVTYTHDPGGVPVVDADIVALFEADGERLQIVGGFEVMSTQPRLDVHADDLSASPVAGDTVLVGAKTWSVESWDLDGAATLYRLWLREPV
jgi:hypothetical protein